MPNITPEQLIQAASDGDFDIVLEGITEQKISPATAQNAFIAAAEKGNTGILLLLNEHKDALGIEVDKRHSTTGNTALFEAAFHGHTETVTFLLENQADPSATTQGGYTPLMAAARNGHFKIVNDLMAHNTHNPDPDSRRKLVDAQQEENGFTALMYAAHFGHANIVDVLLNTYHADRDIPDKTGRRALSFVPDKRSDVGGLFNPREEKSPAPAKVLTLKEVEQELAELEDPCTLDLPDNPISVDKKHYDIESIRQLIGAGKNIPHNQQPFPENFLETMKVDENAKAKIAELKGLKQELEKQEALALAAEKEKAKEKAKVTIHTPPQDEVKESRPRSSSPPVRVSEFWDAQFSPKSKPKAVAHREEKIEIENNVDSFAKSAIQICRQYLDGESQERQRMARRLITNLNDEDKTRHRQDVIEYLDGFLNENAQKTKQRLGLRQSDKIDDPSVLGELDRRLYDHVRRLEGILKPQARHGR